MGFSGRRHEWRRGTHECVRHEDWWTHHRRAMKEFDDKLNGLVAWLDDFVKRNPKNGK
jgi:hypothetical protein